MKNEGPRRGQNTAGAAGQLKQKQDILLPFSNQSADTIDS
jgi:hypothetical protein